MEEIRTKSLYKARTNPIPKADKGHTRKRNYPS